MSAVVTLKLDPIMFDALREAVALARDQHNALRRDQNATAAERAQAMKDEARFDLLLKRISN